MVATASPVLLRTKQPCAAPLLDAAGWNADDLARLAVAERCP